MTLYKNLQCGCCEGYADYLRENGFKVKAIPTNDLTLMGQKYGIPDGMQPCHISLIGGYVVGGHIPIEVIDRLLAEKPRVVGIRLPGMPEGTPGMPGNKPGPLDIYEIGRIRPRSTRPSNRIGDRSPMMANSGRRQIVLAVIAATSLLVAGVLAYDIVRRASTPATQVAGATPTTGSNSTDSSWANPLAVSVFEVACPVPDIRFQDDHHRGFMFADFRGRVVLLNVWATWCVPCRKEMPSLDRLQAGLGGNDFAVVPLSIDRRGDDACAILSRDRLQKLAVYLDPSAIGSRDLAIPGVPTTLLIDRQGREAFRKMGAAEWDDPKIVELILGTLHRGEAGPSERGSAR